MYINPLTFVFFANKRERERERERGGGEGADQAEVDAKGC